MDSSIRTWPITGPLVSIYRDACLVYIYPPRAGIGRRHSLTDKPTVIGRDLDCDLLLDDYSVSRHHARIERRPDGYYAVDLESTNGTFVNEQPGHEHKLNDGDQLRVGDYLYRFLAGGNIEAEYHEEIYRLTIVDALTGCYNKRFLMEVLDRELARSARYDRPLTVIVFDVDCFKALNDKHGHIYGDFALCELAALVRSNLRKEEVFARYGGDEFVIVLPESGPADALGLCERIRSIVESHVFKSEDKSFRITVSLGAPTTGGKEILTGVELIQRADARLYEAKQAGRNRVVAAPADPESQGVSV
jgi:diguanylate cyclase (GGDEF)-like protein